MLSPQLFCIIASLFPLLKSTFVEAKGGELASLVETPFTTNVSHRQDFCARFQAVIDSNGTLDFKNALSGMKLHPVIQYGGGFPYFNYDKETGIDPDNPGLVAEMLDFIAEKANFTWRDSFGVYTGDDKGENKTWTQMLKWTTDTYDISIDKW